MKKLSLNSRYGSFTHDIRENTDFENLFYDYKKDFPEIGSEWLLQTGNGAFTIEDDVMAPNELIEYANYVLGKYGEERRLPYNDYEAEEFPTTFDDVAQVLMKYNGYDGWEEPEEEDYEYIKEWIGVWGI